MHKRLLLFTIWVLQMQSFSFSEAEDFNPLDHIIPNQKRVVDPKSEDLHQNERCRCTCPAFDVPNVAHMPGQIYIHAVKNANDCQCQNVVLPSIPDLAPENYPIMQLHVCPVCKCIYQRRNLAVISYVVVFVCILIALFVSYIFIAQVIWPRFLISLSYKEQRDDEIAMEEVDEESKKTEDEPENEVLNNQSSRFSVLNFLQNQQSKWQRELHQQQRNIYQDHSMLN